MSGHRYGFTEPFRVELIGHTLRVTDAVGDDVALIGSVIEPGAERLARVFAAAPDLLEALKEARRLLAECDTSLGVPDLSQFDAAIAKAEGKP